MTRSKVWLCLCLAAIIVTTIAGADANAADYETEGGAIALTSNGKLTFGSSPTVECNVTLSGTLAGSGSLAAGTHFGSITEVSIRECSGGRLARVLNLPWNIDINAILGTVPNSATGFLLDVHGMELGFEPFNGFPSCLYGGTAGLLMELIPSGGGLYTSGTIELLQELQLAFIRGSGFCPLEIGIAGSKDLSPTLGFQFS